MQEAPAPTAAEPAPEPVSGAAEAKKLVAELKTKYPTVSAHNLLLLTLFNHYAGQGNLGASLPALKKDLAEVYAEEPPTKLYLETRIGRRTNGVTLTMQVPDANGSLEPLSGEALAELVVFNLPLTVDKECMRKHVVALVESFRSSPNREWRKQVRHRVAVRAYLDRNYSVRLMFDRDVEGVKKITEEAKA